MRRRAGNVQRSRARVEDRASAIRLVIKESSIERCKIKRHCFVGRRESKRSGVVNRAAVRACLVRLHADVCQSNDRVVVNAAAVLSGIAAETEVHVAGKSGLRSGVVNRAAVGLGRVADKPENRVDFRFNACLTSVVDRAAVVRRVHIETRLNRRVARQRYCKLGVSVVVHRAAVGRRVVLRHVNVVQRRDALVVHCAAVVRRVAVEPRFVRRVVRQR